MMNQISKTLLLALLFSAFSICVKADGPSVTVVTGPSAPKLELYAAKELAGQFRKLFQAKVNITESVPEGAKNIILIGSPTTNSAITKKDWPEGISDQGHLLKSSGGKLIVGGGSPVATLWAVYELGHSFGIRYLLHGDFFPVEKSGFTLAGFDTVLEPNMRVRAWNVFNGGPASQGSWGADDEKKLFAQLAKLKFNQITLPIYIAEKAGRFPVSGDTAGRSVFDGAKVFENPDFVVANAADGRIAVGIRLNKGIKKVARKLGIKTSGVGEIETLSLGQTKGGMLPQFSTSKLPNHLAEIRKSKKDGFAIKCSIPGNLNADVYFLSRASFDSKITPAQTLENLVTPICGEGVAARLAAGFAAIEEVSALIEKEDPDFAVPDPKMFMEHYTSSKPVPEWWGKASELYGTAVNEMYRGNTRARGGARPFILYHAKYFFFALHYMTAIDATRKAGIARDAKDVDAQIENLEAAVEAMHNALAIYAEVARDNSDRGVIAVLNKYAYRPLTEALNEVPLP